MNNSLGRAGICLALAVLLSIASCIFLSDKQYVQQNPQYQEIGRIVAFVQRWPVYLQLSGQSNLSEDFIKRTTHLLGPWEPAGNLNPRALDVRISMIPYSPEPPFI